MLKKVLFFSIAIILGVVLAYTTYYSYYVNNLYDMIDSAIAEERYEDVARMFTAYFDSDSSIEKIENENGFVYVYPSILQTTKKDTEGNDYISFEKGYSFYSFKIKEEVFTNVTVSSGTTKNDSGMVFSSGEASYEYPFVVTEGDSPYNLATTITSLSCVEVHIGESIINEKLGGEITSFSLLGNEKQPILVYDNVNLDFSERFFEYADDFVENYDLYAPSNDSENFEKFFTPWKEEYSKNETFRISYSQKELKPTSVVWKTVGIMAMYLVVCALVGLLIFKGGKLFKGRGKNDTRYKSRAPMKGNLSKQAVTAKSSNTKVVEAEIVSVEKEDQAIEQKESTNTSVEENKE